MAKKKHETIEEFQAKIEAYFERQRKEKRPLTVQGLAIALDFKSRQSLLNYEGYTDNEDRPFLDTIQKARLLIEENKAEGMLTGDYPTAAVIFDLLNNHGHKNKHETTLKIDKEALTDAELNEQIKRFESRKDNK